MVAVLGLWLGEHTALVIIAQYDSCRTDRKVTVGPDASLGHEAVSQNRRHVAIAKLDL